MAIYTTKSAAKTQEIAHNLAKNFKNKCGIIALWGEMGAGKTTFIQGFAQGLGIKEKVLSPTFLLIRQHKFDVNRILYHIDLYRLNHIHTLEEMGLVEIFNNPNNLILIEWPENLGKLLPNDSINIQIESLNENERRITFPEQPFV